MFTITAPKPGTRIVECPDTSRRYIAIQFGDIVEVGVESLQYGFELSVFESASMPEALAEIDRLIQSDLAENI